MGAARNIGQAIKNPPKPITPPSVRPYSGPRGQLAPSSPKATPLPKYMEKAPETTQKMKILKGKVSPGNFPTKSPKNKYGEIINPTAKDVSGFNARFNTIRSKRS
jgi:hypothetical protein